MKLRKRKSLKKKHTIIQVGRTKITITETGQLPKICICKYSNVPLDPTTGFVADLKYRPINFDMTLCKLKNKVKPIPGWWDGRRWKGLRFRPNDIVIAWKRMPEYD
jgi:hypothetical protein